MDDCPVDALRIPLAGIPGTGWPVSLEFPASRLQPPDVEPLPISQVCLDGVFYPTGDSYLFQGHFSGAFSHACDRCLEESEFPFDAELTWVFAEGQPSVLLDSELYEDAGDNNDDGDGSYRTYQGHEIDLAPHLWEELVLAAPMKFVCSNDCRGLCPVCGVNRNQQACVCVAEAEDDALPNRPFAGLGSLFSENGQPQVEE